MDYWINGFMGKNITLRKFPPTPRLRWTGGTFAKVEGLLEKYYLLFPATK